jgi:uncharacterized protein
MDSADRPLALVTGASSGIGLELARQFAEHGFDLIVAAEDDDIQRAASELSNGARVEPVRVDLARADGVEGLYGTPCPTLLGKIPPGGGRLS